MSNRTVEAVLKLSAKIGDTRAFATIQRELRKVDQQSKSMSRTQAAMAASNRNAYATMARYAAPAVVALGAKEAYTQFAANERQMTRIGITLGATRRDMAGLNKDIAAASGKYALTNDSVMETVGAYAAAGAEISDIRADLDLLAKAQQALDASGGDIVNSWDAARKSFGLAGKDAEKFFEIVGSGSSIGKFEANDMAQYLPSLMPSAAKQGFAGTEGATRLVAFLEVMRDFRGTSGEAATSVSDFLEKISSPDVEKRLGKINKNFTKQIAATRKEGGDMLLTMHDILQKATGGDASKLGQIFGDKEARAAAAVILTDFARIRAAQDEIAKNAPGLLDRNVATVLEDAQARIDKMSNSIGKIIKEAGGGLANAVNPALDSINQKMEFDDAVDKTLEKEGMSPGERQQWKIIQQQNGWFGGGDKRYLKAYEGGWRSEEGKKAARSRTASPDAGMGWGAHQVEPDQKPKSDVIPLPTSRDDALRASEFDQRRLYASGQTSAKVNERALRDKMSDLQEEKFRAETFKTHSDGGATYEERMRSGYYRRNPPSYLEAPQVPLRTVPSFREVEDASVKSYRRDEAAIRDEIEAGGAAAGQSITQAAQGLPALGAEMGANIRNAVGADALGTAIGQAIAAQIRNATAGLTVNVRASGGAAPVNVNSGSTMTNAGRVGGPD